MRVVAALVVAVVLASMATTALANGTPIRIPLTRLSGVANHGEGSPTGLVEITAVEGDVSVATRGLARLSNELYQGWLVNTKSGDRLSVGKFNVTADSASQTRSIVSLGNREFDLFVVTVEPEPDSSPDPDARIVLAGYWPGREPGAAATAAAATASAGGVLTPTALQPTIPAAATIASTQGPTALPRTGGIGFAPLLAVILATAAGAAMLGRRPRT